MTVDIRIIATVLYLFLIIVTIKKEADEGGYLAGLGLILYLPFYTVIYAIFWIIWLNLN